jgi:Putative phage tail protein
MENLMAKAVTEVAVGAAAIGLAIALPGIGEALWLAQGIILPAGLQGALFGLGASSILAGAADGMTALKGNQAGLAVGVTTPIGPWNYVYGRQKVGGIEIFRESNSSQGTSNNKELHRVYVLACHPCAIGSWQLRIDGKQVLMSGSGSGYASHSPTQTIRGIASISRTSGVVTIVLVGAMPAGTDGNTLQVRSVHDGTFNGTWTVTQPNPGDFTTWTYVCGGPDTTSSGGSARTTFSDYKDKIYVELLNGNHTTTFPGLLASGTSWSASDLCLGRTLAYVRMGYDDAVFPSSIPNVSFVIDGKNDILDPRTGTRGFTNNAALCIADYMSLPTKRGGFGLAIGTDIPNAPLISAANICDETVALAGGGSVKRYTCNTVVSLNMTRGTILRDLLSSCGGRLSYQGGQYSIFPAAWHSATLQLTDADLVGPILTRPRHSIRDTCNAIKGTYVSPENAYQQADIPAYMQDAKHGFVADPWLAEDAGERIFREVNFPCTDNAATAQRLAKIALLRTRFQKRHTIRCNLKAYQAVALDVIQLTHPRYTYVNKNFEVLSSRFMLDKSSGKAPRPYVELDIAETDSSIYDWTTTEQLTPNGYKQPNNVGVRICNPPEHVVAYSGPGATIDGIVYPSTITTGADGRVQNSVFVRWDEPNDANVVMGGHLEVQWQQSGASTWTALAKLDPSNADSFITNVSDGQTYTVQVRAVNCAGVPSEWVQASVTVGTSLSVTSYSGIPVAPGGTLIAQATGSTAEILISNFVATVGAATAACTPVPSALTGLNQAQLYYVYYVDPQFAGGSIVPVATQAQADYLGLAGHFLIGSIVTPTSGSTGAYRPSAYLDQGDRTTQTPANAYDANPTTYARLTAQNTSVSGPSNADCLFAWFASYITPSSMTLTVSADLSAPSSCNTSTITARVGSVPHVLFSANATTAQANYTLVISSGTDLSTVSIEAVVGTPTSTGSSTTALRIFDVTIQ